MGLKKILEVFSKEYREQTNYEVFMGQHRESFKLNDNAEPIENKIERLKKRSNPIKSF